VFSDKLEDNLNSIVRVLQGSDSRESSIPPESSLRPQFARKRRRLGNSNTSLKPAPSSHSSESEREPAPSSHSERGRRRERFPKRPRVSDYKSPSCTERTQGDHGAEFTLPRTLNRVRSAHAGDLYMVQDSMDDREEGEECWGKGTGHGAGQDGSEMVEVAATQQSGQLSPSLGNRTPEIAITGTVEHPGQVPFMEVKEEDKEQAEGTQEIHCSSPHPPREPGSAEPDHRSSPTLPPNPTQNIDTAANGIRRSIYDIPTSSSSEDEPSLPVSSRSGGRQRNDKAAEARERADEAEKDRVAKEKEEKELAKEKAERERLAKEKAEKERLAKEKAEKAEKERLAKEKAEEAERERLAKEKAEAEKKEKTRKQRLARAAARRTQAAKEQAEKLEREKAERLERERVEKAERLDREKAEKAEKAERVAREKAEKTERLAHSSQALAADPESPVPIPNPTLRRSNLRTKIPKGTRKRSSVSFAEDRTEISSPMPTGKRDTLAPVLGSKVTPILPPGYSANKLVAEAVVMRAPAKPPTPAMETDSEAGSEEETSSASDSDFGPPPKTMPTATSRKPSKPKATIATKPSPPPQPYRSLTDLEKMPIPDVHDIHSSQAPNPSSSLPPSGTVRKTHEDDDSSSEESSGSSESSDDEEEVTGKQVINSAKKAAATPAKKGGFLSNFWGSKEG